MAEVALDFSGLTKSEAYARAESQIVAVLEGTDDGISAMSTIAALLHHGFGHLWTGFYRVRESGVLSVGPYQGSLGCLEISMGRGVCGTAAAQRRSVIVPDVSAFPDHITCDLRSRSEIVVPVFDGTKNLVAVLDIDSERLNAFDEEDRVGLERIVDWFAR